MAAHQRTDRAGICRRYGRVVPGVLAAAVLAAGGLACGGTADEGKLPPDVQDPATLKTPAGALARYRGALSHVGAALDAVVTASGIITDELAALPAPRGVGGRYAGADSRQDLSAFSQPLAARLHHLRAQAREARGFVEAYVSDTATTVSKSALRGHLFAVEAYADVWLADLFCSGIPLSTVDFDGNYTLSAGLRTAEVYRRAAALFDSALAVTSDSTGLQLFAAVGKGRALLALDSLAAAAAAVAGVPNDYRYEVPFTYSDFPTEIFDPSPAAAPDSAALWFFRAAATVKPAVPSAADLEGGNGLDYRSSADPRTAVAEVGILASGDTAYFPLKYDQPPGTASFVQASGVEARLIEAEAALRANPGDGQWLAILNQLRQTAWTTIVPATSGPLPDLTDPGTEAGRVDLLFRERAFWLYLTGHRQGDLRRLIRDYSRLGYAPNSVYPVGIYPGAGGTYGSEIVVPMPDDERVLNPKYTGCIDHNA